MKNRLHAFLIHLILSAVIAAVVMVIVFWVWYPAPLHEAVGVTGIFLLLMAVDVTIGPVITLIIYKPDKPSLKFDLAVVALLQLCALSYGVNTVFAGRPAFIVFSKDRFEIARASDLDPDSVAKALQRGNQAAIAGWAQPRWVAALPSLDPKRNQDILFSAVQGAPDWPLLPELYVPLAQVKEQILSRAKPLQELRALSGQEGGLKLLADWRDGKAKWLPLRGKVKNMTVLVDPVSAAVIEIIDIDPWSASANL
ncbi:TfpX/TfpZ family type IV pilin accessory protein [Methylomicrobium sp. Wu6]|uniref:TfpX/TfpZ family type IV pilin accessory protein n=1 Tax=Methylomicrobium sp. Wu6 TaxID=3107928 RepID=UPI002DD6BA0E|nr:TfpX/TfpZ family type IV pilin accessory protein [Methylomicrobium sp. Wu6]MEC4747830.1 TfpX/TfpZ family type IV pilin accessory protein [Methylomicrobium sp. Wu6]